MRSTLKLSTESYRYINTFAPSYHILRLIQHLMLPHTSLEITQKRVKGDQDNSAITMYKTDNKALTSIKKRHERKGV